MNYFKIVILSLLLSIHCGIQSSISDDSDDDFFNNDALNELIDRDIHYYEVEDQNNFNPNNFNPNILDQDDDASQVSDHFDADNAVDNNFQDQQQDQQNNNYLIIPSQAGKKAYDDVYSQLYKIDEPDDSENNKYAIAQAEKDQRAAYNRAYRQLTKSKDVMEKREQKRRAMQHGGIPTIEGQQNNDLIIAKEAGQQAYDDVYRQLRKVDEPDNSKNNKYARAQATNARMVAYKKAYRQTEQNKAAEKRRRQKKRAMQHGGVPAEADNYFQDQQNHNNYLIIAKQAGKKAYDDVYSQLRRIDESDDSENNKKAIALATKARSLAYKKAYGQTEQGKILQAAASKRYYQSDKFKAARIPAKRKYVRSSVDNNFQDQQNNYNLITPYQAGKKAYDDVYSQLRRIDEPDDSQNNKQARVQAEKDQRAAYNRAYRQTEKGKAAEERKRQERRTMQHGGISVNSQINLVDQPELVENSNNVGGDLYQNENIDNESQVILNMNDNIDNEIDDLLNGLDPYELL